MVIGVIAHRQRRQGRATRDRGNRRASTTAGIAAAGCAGQPRYMADVANQMPRRCVIGHADVPSMTGVMRGKVVGMWPRLLRRVHCATADNRPAAGASAKFGKGHFHRHDIVFPCSGLTGRMIPPASSSSHRADSGGWFKRVNPFSAGNLARTNAGPPKYPVNVSFRGCFDWQPGLCWACDHGRLHRLKRLL